MTECNRYFSTAVLPDIADLRNAVSDGHRSGLWRQASEFRLWLFGRRTDNLCIPLPQKCKMCRGRRLQAEVLLVSVLADQDLKQNTARMILRQLRLLQRR